MDRAFSSGASGSAPSAPASPSIGYPTAGNPGTGTPATKPGPYWYHMIMEELLTIVVAAGITPSSGTLNQLLQALRSAGVFVTQSVSDDSTRVATTGWVRAAMSNIATAAGFAASFTTNGYVKFPSWLGGWVIQWGTASGSTSTPQSSFSYPITFPSAIYAVVGNLMNQTGGSFPSCVFMNQIGSLSACSYYFANMGAGYAWTLGWIAVGK